MLLVLYRHVMMHLGSLESSQEVEVTLALLCGGCSGLMVSAFDYGAFDSGASVLGCVVLCSWARHFILIVPLSTQVCKWVLANLTLGGNTVMDWLSIQGGVEILLVTSRY